jgi:hypothetical protein
VVIVATADVDPWNGVVRFKPVKLQSGKRTNKGLDG